MLIIGVHVIFIATLGVDITAAMMPEQQALHYEETFTRISMITTVGILVSLSLLDILIGAVLLRNLESLPTLLQIFALVTVIQGALAISVIFSFIAILSFPISLIILSVYFLRKPESIEVV